MEFASVHGCRINGMERASKGSVDIGLVAGVSGREASQLPHHPRAVSLFFPFLFLWDDLAPQIDSLSAIRPSFLCVVFLQIQKAVVICEQMESLSPYQCVQRRSDSDLVLPQILGLGLMLPEVEAVSVLDRLRAH